MTLKSKGILEHFCSLRRLLAESIYNRKTNKLNPPREDLGRKKCLDRTDCIMQNYLEPT